MAEKGNVGAWLMFFWQSLSKVTLRQCIAGLQVCFDDLVLRSHQRHLAVIVRKDRRDVLRRCERLTYWELQFIPRWGEEDILLESTADQPPYHKLHRRWCTIFFMTYVSVTGFKLQDGFFLLKKLWWQNFGSLAEQKKLPCPGIRKASL